MESRHEESPKALEPSAAPKPKRFRIIKLEERIAPNKGKGEVPSHHVKGCVSHPTCDDDCYFTNEGTICGGACTGAIVCS
jgi:hypothetical protein